MISKIFYKQKNSDISSPTTSNVSTSSQAGSRQGSGGKTNNHQSDEASFRQSTMKKTWLDKRNETKEKELKLKQQ